MSSPPTHFRHCPACGQPVPPVTGKSLSCPACHFTYFFNPTIGTAGFIGNDRGEILLIQRARDPGKGKLAPPGGFADYGESAEAALTREVHEETGLMVTGWKYLVSAVNHYTYREVTYPVIDFFYCASVGPDPVLTPCRKETAGARWFRKDSVDPDSLAFPSMQEAFRVWLRQG